MNLLRDSYISFVNLDTRQDRLLHMQKELARIGIVAHRTRGMLPSEYTGDPARVAVMQNRTPGAIGCHFSQVAIMKEALRRGAHAFVMEDDLVFCDDFADRLAYMEAFLATHVWDIMWLGATFHVGPPHWHKESGRDAETTHDPRILRTFGAFCTYAYIVNRNSISHVLSGLDRLLDKSMGIDWAMIQMQPNLWTYAFVPGSVIQMDNESDIGQSRNPAGKAIGRGYTRFSLFNKLGPYWFQKKMHDFDPRLYDWKEAKVL